MTSRTWSTPRLAAHPRGAGLAWRVALLAALALGLGLFLASQPPMPQAPEYLRFADERALLGLPRALDVLSNLPFAAVGLWGLWLLLSRRALPGDSGRALLADPRQRAPERAPARGPWVACFAGVALTSLGSAWFHLDPTIGRLVWDRLPMTVGFMGLLAALVAERIDARAGARLLWPLLLAGAASVASWWWTERAGRGDLRPYFFVQFFPLAAVPLVLLLFPRPAGRDAARADAAPRTGAWLAALALYGLAKLCEAEDAPLLALGAVSGHTLKHLLAAAAIGVLAWRLRARPGGTATAPPGA